MSALDEVVRLLTHSEYAMWRDPNPERSAVTALQHALQCGTRAVRAHASRDEIVMALIHDAARPLNDIWHGEVIAEIARDRIHPDCYEALKRHGAFQMDIMHGTNVTERWREERWYPVAKRLAGWDAVSFDPAYRSESLDYFVGPLAHVFGQ